MATEMKKTKTPGVYKRGNRYVVTWRDRGKLQKEFFAKYEDARKAKARRTAGDRRRIPKVRFDAYAPAWIKSYRGRTARGFSETTRVEYRRDIEHLAVPYFGRMLLDDIYPGDVKQWFAWLEERRVSVSGVRKAKAAVGALFATAVEDEKAKSNPVRGVRYVPANDVELPRKLRPLTLAELERVMGALPKEWGLFFILLAHTGIRISEMLGLTWADVHLGDDPRLSVVDQVYKGERKGLKTAKAKRTLPLSQGAAVALTAWREESDHTEPDRPVFASSTGTALNYSNVYNRVWVPARDAAGIDGEEVGAFHALRHTLGSVLHQRTDKTDRQLSDWLGHADPAFSVREYVGTMDEGLGSADFLDETIPLEWVTRGERESRKEPETEPVRAGEDPQSRAADTEQPQTAAKH